MDIILRKIGILLITLFGVVYLHAGTVNLNFFVGSTKIHTEVVTEGGTYTLSSIISGASIDMTDYECRDFEFVGWKAAEPIASGEVYNPAEHITITPYNNLNLYAVFQHTDASKINGYFRVTQTTDLEDDGQYLIICYYVYGGEQQYYAMTSTSGTYAYNGTKYNRLNATRLYPRNGEITAPDESVIWTLKESATPGQWKWTNTTNEVTKWLFIGASDQTMLVNTEGAASSCAITQANGIFTIRNTANDSILKYVDDFITEEEDYFITGSYTDYVIYLYKKESAYTSYPDCSNWTVNLDALDGTIKGVAPATSTYSLRENTPGGGVTLPEAEVTGMECDGWEFVGWTIDAPAKSSNTAPEHLIPAGHYDPLYNGVTLYAVYRRTGEVTYYEKITNKSQITAKTGGVDDEYIILTNNENQVVTTSYVSGSKWNLADITTSGGAISVEEATRIGNAIWNYDGTMFVGKDTKKILAYQENASYYFYVNNYTPPFYFRETYYSSYYLYWSTTTTDEESSSSGDKHKFYIYKKTTKSETNYTPYPHCAPYTIHLHACGGNIDGQQNVSIPQVSAISGITLPLATPACPAEGWEFVGWFLGEDKESFDHVEFTDFLAAGDPYIPDHDDTHLYAIYKRVTDKFKIVSGGVSAIASGDTYVISYYSNDGSGSSNIYDWLISSQTYDANHLKAEKYESPQNGDGFYIIVPDSTVMWTLTGSENTWYVQNLMSNEYLDIRNTSGYTRTNASAVTTYIKNAGGSLPVNLSYVTSSYSSTTYYNLGGNILSDHETAYFSTTKQYTSSGNYAPFSYIYRRVKEYSSWPHCDPFTVNFDACGGNTEDDGSEKTEPEAYAGITLPRAYANTDCSKEGWRFAGWCTMPITEETDLMTFDLYPAGTKYYPRSSHTTLYAVYMQKTNHYKRITTEGRLHTGVNYIIATDGNKALANLPDDASTPAAVIYAPVVPDAAHIITNSNTAIEWRLEGVKGEYEWYNPARDVYLNLKETGKALLDKTTAVDNFDVTYNGSSYLIRSCMSIAHSSDAKYLGLNRAGTYFIAVKDTAYSTTKLYIYRQQANYNSYPVCTEDIDVIKWAKVDDEFNSVTVESYHLKGVPDVHGSYGSPELQDDGTYLIKFRNEKLPPCTKAMVEWDGVTSRIRIPHIVSENANMSSFLTPANDCSECDVYIEPGKTLTVTATDTIRKLYIPDNATLNIRNDMTLNVSIFSLFSEGDQAAPIVNLNARGSIFLRDDRLYYDKRIDDARYYWFSLPFDAHVKEISFVNIAANGGEPEYYAGSDGDDEDRAFFIKYYNGALRAADANGGALATTYWTDVTTRGTDYTLKAGLGYEIGLADQSAKYFNGQDYTHTSRTFRFTMRPEVGESWLVSERTGGGSKSAIVTPSTVTDERNAVHAGWNLIGNPYMHTYNTGTVPDDGNIRKGHWVEKLDAYGDRTGYWWILDTEHPDTYPQAVPYLTLYDPSKPRHNRYSQVLASCHDLRPFEAVFVQVNEGNTLNFGMNMNVSAMPAYRRSIESEGPVRTGIIISGADYTDRTGFVLSEEYTSAYEIGADLEKVVNNYTKKGVTTYSLNLYSLDSLNRQLAFNGLSPEAAADTIPLGVTCPENGEYTFSFDADWYGVKAKYIESLELIDYQTHQAVNLLNNIYSFSAAANQVIHNRFALVIRLKEQPGIATDFEQIETEPSAVRKIIKDGHLYILRENDIFNAVGAKVR